MPPTYLRLVVSILLHPLSVQPQQALMPPFMPLRVLVLLPVAMVSSLEVYFNLNLLLISLRKAAYPTLTPEKIQMLATLFEPLPDPSIAVVQSWAKLLQADEHDVYSWVTEERGKKEDIRTGVNYLPSPFYSTSPEPFLASRGFTPFKPEPNASPVIPAFPPGSTLPRPPRRSDFVRTQVVSRRLSAIVSHSDIM